MSKINFNTENPEIEINRAIGKKSDGKITLNTEGGSIEVDLGFASVGATTDYGGAVSVGLLGQEITWGREGGTIHIGIGGFAVDVEARDCIVTEIKSIFGIVVAQRSYPDPGCKLPEPPPPAPPAPVPNPRVENEIELPDTDDIGWVAFSEKIYQYSWGVLSRVIVQKRSATDTDNPTTDPDILASRPSTRLPYTSVNTSSHPNAFWEAPIVPKGSYLQARTLSTFRRDGTGDISHLVLVYYSGSTAWSRVCLYGVARTIKKFIEDYNEEMQKHLAAYMENPQFTNNIIELIPTAFIPLKPVKSGPFLPTGNKPPMKNCCQDILDMLEDIKEAYAVDRILKDKFPVSNIFMAPECDPASQTVAKNFYEILQCLFRTLAHGLIFEPRVNIKDADAAKAGDQEFKAKYLNATGWASFVAEALLEVKDDGNVSTNMDIRNAFAVTQTMVGLSDAIYRLNALLDSVGVELIPVTETVDTPYNLQIQIGKGFGEGNERQIDLNTDEATEKLLPELLRVKSNKIKTVDIHPRSRSLKEILENIESKLPTNKNG
ncbi:MULTISPECIES: hypothetical protein [unclassified Microcoleus]|uniref:hypothetical protein n=1 Tax=unclassified Microcoleus TaxID=2642155 RepID=UPI002FD1FB90